MDYISKGRHIIKRHLPNMRSVSTVSRRLATNEMLIQQQIFVATQSSDVHVFMDLVGIFKLPK